MNLKRNITSLFLCIGILFIGCSPRQDAIPAPVPVYDTTVIKGGFFEVSKHFDFKSNTWYFLTRIEHEGKSGNVIKLYQGGADKNKPLGEISTDFAERTNAKLVFNASISKYINTSEGKEQVSLGIEIVDGEIINNNPMSFYTLGIKDNNKLLVYPPKVTAEEILADGTNKALTGFVPLIQNHQSVSKDIIDLVGNLSAKNPRQVIAQFDDMDILFFTTGGRGFGGTGMTAQDMIRILAELDVRFAYNLDGGGSTSTVVNGQFINWEMDGHGTQQRPRTNFLYFK